MKVLLDECVDWRLSRELQGKTNRLADLLPLVPRLLAAIESALPGSPKFIGPV